MFSALILLSSLWTCYASEADGAADTQKPTFVWAIAGFGLLLLLSIVAFVCARRKNQLDESPYDIDIASTTDDDIQLAFPDLKPAFERFPSNMTASTAELVSPRISSNPPTNTADMLARQGSMVILQELCDNPIDLTPEEAEELEWDSYGNSRLRTHNVIFAEEEDAVPATMLNKKNMDFHD